MYSNKCLGIVPGCHGWQSMSVSPANACCRVSHIQIQMARLPQIRELLQQGHVESVEQLLGRKYRLVCCGRAELAAGAGTGAGPGPAAERSAGAGGQPAAAAPSATKQEDGDGIGSGTASSSRSSSSSAAVAGMAGVGGSVLRLPASCYRNQAPAYGQYRALVQVLPAAADLTSVGYSGFGTAMLPYGPACVNVSLGEEGIQVELDSDMAGKLLTQGQEVAMVVDFDACG